MGGMGLYWGILGLKFGRPWTRFERLFTGWLRV